MKLVFDLMKLIPCFYNPVNKIMNISGADEYENVASSLIEFKDLRRKSEYIKRMQFKNKTNIL